MIDDYECGWNFEGALGQYIDIAFCEADVKYQIVKTEVVSTNAPSRYAQAGENLITSTGDGNIEYETICIAACDSLIMPKCGSICGSPMNDSNKPSCSYDFIPVCDSDDPTLPVYSVVEVCEGNAVSIGFVLLDQVAGTSEPYEIVGELQGEGCTECELASTETKCDVECNEVDIIYYTNCPTQLFEAGTDIPYEGKGGLVECTKDYISEDCGITQEIHYTWDNGVVRCPLSGLPLSGLYMPRPPAANTSDCGGYLNVYDTPYGQQISPATYAGNGFIDRYLTCGTATIDAIIIDGNNILANPVIETTTTGTWGGLNKLLWNQISLWYDGTLTSFPSGTVCDNNRPEIKPVNCAGRSISCYDINPESFTVTDCRGTVRTYSILKNVVGEVEYQQVTYIDCNGDPQCEFINKVSKEVVTDIDTSCLMDCIDEPIQKGPPEQVCIDGAAYYRYHYDNCTWIDKRHTPADDCCPTDFAPNCRILKDDGSWITGNYDKWTETGYDDLAAEIQCPNTPKILNYAITVYIDGTEYTASASITIPSNPNAITTAITAALNQADPNSSFSSIGTDMIWDYDDTVDVGFKVVETLGNCLPQNDNCNNYSFHDTVSGDATDCICADVTNYPYASNGSCTTDYLTKSAID